jgi:hypothetical protein
MAITPNYSWPLPDDTDLVKDGAEAIRDLGNAIDTTVDGLGGGGLIHIETVSFSGAVSHSFGSDANPIFTSEFTNYKIIFDDIDSAVTNTGVSFRLRANTTDLTTSVYVSQSISVDNTTVSANRTSTTQAPFASFGFNANFRSSAILEIQNPQTAKYSSFQTLNAYNPNTGDSLIRNYAGQVKDSGQYNGFTIFGANNISGTMSVYGYKK